MLSKIAWLLVQPVSLAVLFGLVGLLLMFTRWKWAARLAVLLSMGALFTSAFTTLGYILLRPLEAAFERPAVLPQEVTGIVVLGGGMDSEINEVRGGFELNRSGDRYVEALRLAQIYPTAKVVFTGGLGDIGQTGEPEAVAGERFFLGLGVASDRLLLEARSRNTEENAVFTKALVEPKPGDTWLLVTSAFHMPRSVGLFRKAGFDVVPWPSDYLGTGAETFALTLHQPAENITVTTMAVREWVGLIAYYLAGKIDEPVPGRK